MVVLFLAGETKRRANSQSSLFYLNRLFFVVVFFTPFETESRGGFVCNVCGLKDTVDIIKPCDKRAA